MNLFNVYQWHQLATAMTADTRITEHVGLAILQGSWAMIFSKLFSKRCTFGSKSGGTKSLVRRYQARFAKTVPEHLSICHIWLRIFF